MAQHPVPSRLEAREGDTKAKGLEDYSYAGYHNGEVALPDGAKLPVISVQPKAGDNTADLQAALDEAARRGAVVSLGEYWHLQAQWDAEDHQQRYHPARRRTGQDLLAIHLSRGHGLQRAPASGRGGETRRPHRVDHRRQGG